MVYIHTTHSTNFTYSPHNPQTHMVYIHPKHTHTIKCRSLTSSKTMPSLWAHNSSHELYICEKGGNGAMLSSVLPTATAFLQEGPNSHHGRSSSQGVQDSAWEAEAEPLKTPLSVPLLTNRMTIITRMLEHHLPTLQNKLSSCFYNEECSFHFYILQITKRCLHKTKLQYYQKINFFFLRSQIGIKRRSSSLATSPNNEKKRARCGGCNPRAKEEKAGCQPGLDRDILAKTKGAEKTAKPALTGLS